MELVENTGLYNSDGVTTFATGAFAPGVTVSDVTYRILAADAGVKWRGVSVNAQYFFRWLNSFRADGPLPIGSNFDHGFEMTLSQFIVPKKWELYGRTSFVFGQFRNSYEYAPGVKWYNFRESSCLARRRGSAHCQVPCFIGHYSIQLRSHRLVAVTSVDVQLLRTQRHFSWRRSRPATDKQTFGRT
jgi:hypothetical protein